MCQAPRCCSDGAAKLRSPYAPMQRSLPLSHAAQPSARQSVGPCNERGMAGLRTDAGGGWVGGATCKHGLPALPAASAPGSRQRRDGPEGTKKWSHAQHGQTEALPVKPTQPAGAVHRAVHASLAVNHEVAVELRQDLPLPHVACRQAPLEKEDQLLQAAPGPKPGH